MPLDFKPRMREGGIFLLFCTFYLYNFNRQGRAYFIFISLENNVSILLAPRDEPDQFIAAIEVCNTSILPETKVAALL